MEWVNLNTSILQRIEYDRWIDSHLVNLMVLAPVLYVLISPVISSNRSPILDHFSIWVHSHILIFRIIVSVISLITPLNDLKVSNRSSYRQILFFSKLTLSDTSAKVYVFRFDSPAPPWLFIGLYPIKLERGKGAKECLTVAKPCFIRVWLYSHPSRWSDCVIHAFFLPATYKKEDEVGIVWKEGWNDVRQITMKNYCNSLERFKHMKTSKYFRICW